MRPEQHFDPEANEADQGEQRAPVLDVDVEPAAGRDVTPRLPLEAPEADLLEQAAALPVDDDDLPRG